TIAVTTDANGNASFTSEVPGVATAGQFVSATATDSAGNTSEFSADSQVADATTSVALDGSGNLVITDIASGGKNDNLTLSYNAAKREYVIADPTAIFGTTVGTANGQHEVDVPVGDVTGKIEVNTGAGDDTLTVDYSGGTPL